MAAQDHFQTAYAEFVSKYGVLYERTEVAMTDTDRKKVKQFFWVVLFFIVLFSGIGGVTYYFNADKGITLGFVIFLSIALLIIGYTYRYITQTLQENKKLLIKAVVIAKKERKGFEIKLSGQDYLNISDAEYKTLALGDIVEIEKVGKSLAFTHKISRVGSIYKPDDLHA